MIKNNETNRYPGTQCPKPNAQGNCRGSEIKLITVLTRQQLKSTV
jgi:hypothetical protein